MFLRCPRASRVNASRIFLFVDANRSSHSGSLEEGVPAHGTVMGVLSTSQLSQSVGRLRLLYKFFRVRRRPSSSYTLIVTSFGVVQDQEALVDAVHEWLYCSCAGVLRDVDFEGHVILRAGGDLEVLLFQGGCLRRIFVISWAALTLHGMA